MGFKSSKAFKKLLNKGGGIRHSYKLGGKSYELGGTDPLNGIASTVSNARITPERMKQLISNLTTVGGSPVGSGPILAPEGYGAITPNQEFNFSSVAPFMDNLANLVTTSKTPNIPDPVLNSPVALDTDININPQIRQITDDTTAFNKGVTQSTSSAGVAGALKSKALSNKFRAIGDLQANKQNQEAQLRNQQAVLNQRTQAINNQLINQTNLNKAIRQDDINRRYGSVVSDFGQDIANISRENNQRQLDRERFQILSRINPDAIYQFADTSMFKDMYRDDEKGLRDLILRQKGEIPRAKLAKVYKELFNKDI